MQFAGFENRGIQKYYLAVTENTISFLITFKIQHEH